MTGRNRTRHQVPACTCGRHISARADGLRIKHRPDANSVVGPYCPGSDQPIDQETR